MDNALQLVFFAAVVTKTIQMIRDASGKVWPTWLLNLLSFGLGITVAEVFKLDAVAALLGSSTGSQHTLGVVLTGLALGGGASGLHDLLDLFSSIANARKAQVPQGQQAE